MRPSIGLVLVLLAGMVAAQATSPPPLCFAFNDPPPPSPALVPGVGVSPAGLVVWFTSPTTATIDALELWRAPFVPYNFAVQIFQVAGPGVPPAGWPLGVYFGTAYPTGSNGWTLFNTALGAALVSGSNYALKITANSVTGSPSTCWQVFYNPAGPQQLPYQISGTAACPASLPATGSMGFMARFRGAACGPGPPASVSWLGTECGSTSLPGLISSFSPPVLGSLWPLGVTGPSGETAMLFWSGSVNAAGSPIAAGSSCLFYLHAASVASLALMGAEPLVTAVLTTGSGWSFPVPLSPAYAGFVIGLQAAIIGPSGTIPIGGGAFCHTTNALQLTLGY